MVEPVSVIISLGTIIKAVVVGVNFLKKTFGSSSTTTTTTTTTFLPIVVRTYPLITREPLRIKKKKSLSDSFFPISVILILVVVVVGLIALIVYRKQNSLKRKSRYSEKQIDSPPRRSPSDFISV